MTEEKPEFSVFSRRPVDCSPQLIKVFIDQVLQGGEIPMANLKFGVYMAERLFFAHIENRVVGVSAIRYLQTAYHKHVFKQAGITEMYNPDAIEACWVCVSPEFQQRGIWRLMGAFREEYLGNRPTIGFVREENKHVVDNTTFSYVGKPFKALDKDHLVRIVIRNHDPVYDKSKALIYGEKVV